MAATKEKPKSKATNGKAPKAKKAKPVKEPKVKTLSEIQAEHYEQIKSKEIEVGELERVYLKSKEETKNAKEEFESADHALRRLIACGPDAQRKLPFQDNPPKPAAVKVEPPPSANDAWRETPLAELFNGTLLERLTDAGITSIGKLADYTATEKRLTDIKGIGPGAEAKIGDTMAEWFAKHPEHCGKPEESNGSGIASIKFTAQPSGQSVTLTHDKMKKLANASGALKQLGEAGA